MSNINPFGPDDNSISALVRTQRIEVNPVTSVITIMNAGPQGPPGPPGSNGAAIAYVHVQTDVSSSWLINHDLGFYPNFSAQDEDGVGLEPAYIHHSEDQLELQFNTPRAGTARLS